MKLWKWGRNRHTKKLDEVILVRIELIFYVVWNRQNPRSFLPCDTNIQSHLVKALCVQCAKQEPKPHRCPSLITMTLCWMKKRFNATLLIHGTSEDLSLLRKNDSWKNDSQNAPQCQVAISKNSCLWKASTATLFLSKVYAFQPWALPSMICLQLRLDLFPELQKWDAYISTGLTISWELGFLLFVSFSHGISSHLLLQNNKYQYLREQKMQMGGGGGRV